MLLLALAADEADIILHQSVGLSLFLHHGKNPILAAKVLAATAWLGSLIQALADRASSARRHMMPPSVRRATPEDLPEMVNLLVRDGEQRRLLDPTLWPLDADIRTRIERVVADSFNPSTRVLWLLAEASERIVGITHSMIVPVPPIYQVAAGPPGLFLDDCFTTEDAPPGTAEALLVATEAALRATGAAALIASCPAAGPWRTLYERHGYEPVTMYMAKHGFSVHALPPSVRPAGPEDVSGIVKLSADHRKTLAELNPRFWPVHPEADSRFHAWMQYSLTLPDRDMIVAGGPGAVHGYIIAQPVSALLVPAAHDIKAIGVIDDFYDQDFANVSAVSNGGATAADLLSAAESAFGRRAFAVVLIVCPAAWTAKVFLLEREGYRTAKLWMLKR